MNKQTTLLLFCFFFVMYALLNLQFLEFTLFLTGEIHVTSYVRDVKRTLHLIFFFHSSFSCNLADFDEFRLAVF